MAPPLDIDLNAVDTSLPLIADSDQIYEVQVAEVNPGSTKAGAPMIKLRMDTITPTKSAATDTAPSRDLGPGIPIFENINLQPSGKSDWGMVTRNVGSVVQTFIGRHVTWAEFVANAPTLLQGQTGRVKIGVEPAGTDKNGKAFKAKNVIKLWLPKNAA